MLRLFLFSGQNKLTAQIALGSDSLPDSHCGATVKGSRRNSIEVRAVGKRKYGIPL
jgi:hypothetical protein